MVDTILQARDENLYGAITDCGAGGLSSAVGEMGEELGAKVFLEKVPLKYKGLSYMEIWISESQERMVLAVPPEKIGRLQEVFAGENVEATVIGEFGGNKRLQLYFRDVLVCDLDMRFLHKGIPQPEKKAVFIQNKFSEPDFSCPRDLKASLLKLLGHYNICSKEWVIRQYDHRIDIERVSGMPYSEFIKERLMLPNGLFESSVPYLGTDRDIPGPFAAGNYIGDGFAVPWTEDNMSLNVAEGNMIATPADLGRWVRALISGNAGLSAETISQMTECASMTSESSCYGLGIYGILSPIKGYGHSGAHAGYLSLMMHDPDTQVTTVLFISLLNYDDVMGEGEFMNSVREAAYEVLGY